MQSKQSDFFYAKKFLLPAFPFFSVSLYLGLNGFIPSWCPRPNMIPLFPAFPVFAMSFQAWMLFLSFAFPAFALPSQAWMRSSVYLIMVPFLVRRHFAFIIVAILMSTLRHNLRVCYTSRLLIFFPPFCNPRSPKSVTGSINLQPQGLKAFGQIERQGACFRHRIG